VSPAHAEASGLEIRKSGWHGRDMHRACLILVALAVAIATSFVPVHRAAKPAGSALPAAGAEQLAATVGAADAYVPVKRCQSGAGLLACPFYRPSAETAVRRSDVAQIRFERDETVLTGRKHPATARPPKAFSV